MERDYLVSVSALRDGEAPSFLGKTVVKAAGSIEAGSIAMQELWDPRLDAADCNAKVVAKRSAFDRFQRFVLDEYDEGSFGYIEKRGDLKMAMDGLLSFLVVELSEKEGCEDVDEVLRRISVAKEQLEELEQSFVSRFKEQGSPSGVQRAEKSARSSGACSPGSVESSQPVHGGVEGEAEYDVVVSRTGYSSLAIKVKAGSRSDAEQKALDSAGDHEFSDHDATYEVESVVPLSPAIRRV